MKYLLIISVLFFIGCQIKPKIEPGQVWIRVKDADDPFREKRLISKKLLQFQMAMSYLDTGFLMKKDYIILHLM